MASDAPPTSLLQPEERNYSQVIFSKVEKSYEPGADIDCCFTFTSEFQPERKDWVGIFKVSWKTTREYYTWISAVCSEPGSEKRVTFKAYYLPKENDDYYQFCYVDQNGEVRGVSVPFQFCHKVLEEDIVLVTTEEKQRDLQETILQLQAKVALVEKEKCGLRDERKQLELELENKAAQQLECSKRNDRLQQQNQELEEELEEERCRNRFLLQTAEEEQKRLQNQSRSVQVEHNQFKEENLNLQEQIKEMALSLKKYSEAAKNSQEEAQVLKGKLRDNEEGHHLLQEQLQEIQMERKKDKFSIDLLTKEVAGLRQNLEKKMKAVETTEKQLDPLQRENASLLQQIQDVKCMLELRKAEISDMQEQRMRDCEEIEQLNRLLSQRSLPTPRHQGLYSHNPHEGESLISFGNEPQYGEAPGGGSGQQIEMTCPECAAEFEDFQVFQDHVMCHDLASMG
ncbi:calcium-binding and coiled-coil domain-containing protein 2 [Xenopus laevis]|uniref:C2H2-type domain-containing protein n=2 Tax=Xenopus laevis TaxID=8355 RepID=A0A974H054_XENLA|nr:calcium-binding and coiled-coil domain-containing protein 2 [Xenopus laevis]OCT59974.1 hypothetical protein XELAEV_18045993mg [Xenopus laevis]